MTELFFFLTKKLLPKINTESDDGLPTLREEEKRRRSRLHYTRSNNEIDSATDNAANRLIKTLIKGLRIVSNS